MQTLYLYKSKKRRNVTKRLYLFWIIKLVLLKKAFLIGILIININIKSIIKLFKDFKIK